MKQLRRAIARARHIQHNLDTSDHPATCYMRVDVIAQLAVNWETRTELHRPSIRGLCICFFVLREISWPVETCLDQRNPPHTATTQGVKNKSICTEILVVIIRSTVLYLVSHSLAPCIVPDWTVVKIGHPGIGSSLLIHQWLTDSGPRANVLIITVIIILIA
jgi:hypothetical protein